MEPMAKFKQGDRLRITPFGIEEFGKSDQQGVRTNGRNFIYTVKRVHSGVFYVNLPNGNEQGTYLNQRDARFELLKKATIIIEV